MWYLVIRRNVKPHSEWTVSLDEHLRWMEDRHRALDILLSGPSPDYSLGIYLIHSESRKDAERIAGSDPLTAAGLCEFELFEWDIRQAFGIGPFSESAIRAMYPDQA